jgi:hypothetical protein
MNLLARKSRTISNFRVPTVEEIREARKKRLVAVMLAVSGDESHDDKKQRVFAVAGIMGTQEQWDTLTPIRLARTGGKVFHAADCEAGYGPFRFREEGLCPKSQWR